MTTEEKLERIKNLLDNRYDDDTDIPDEIKDLMNDINEIIYYVEPYYDLISSGTGGTIWTTTTGGWK